MQYLSKKIIPILSISALLMFSACSQQRVVQVSGAHLYNNDFGMVQNYQADAAIREEFRIMSQPTQVDVPIINNPEIYTELQRDPEAFLAHEYVETAPVITYKYEFDPNFYSKAEWRKMDLE